MSPALRLFFEQEVGIEQFAEQEEILENFLELDDYDIWGAIKMWAKSDDEILSKLCRMLLNRELFRIKFSSEPTGKEEKRQIKAKIAETYGLKPKDTKYFFSTGQVQNNAYLSTDKKIMIVSKNGQVRDVVEAADLPNIKAMSKIVRKYYRCWPKDIEL